MPPVVQKQSPVKKVAAKKTGTILDQIQPMEFDDEEGIKILLYGRTATGKTTLWSTFPAPILAIICSGGQRPGELKSINTPQNRRRIETVTVKNSLDLVALAKYQAETNHYKTVVIDHVTGLQDHILAEILGMEVIPAQKSWGLATQQQYGICTAQCKEHLRSFLSLSCNVVIVGQEKVSNIDEDKLGVREDAMESNMLQPFVSVELTPKLAGWLPPACDYVCQMVIRARVEEKVIKIGNQTQTKLVRIPNEVDYCLRTAPHDIYASKFRIPRERVPELPEFIVDPSYDKIMKLIKG